MPNGQSIEGEARPRRARAANQLELEVSPTDTRSRKRARLAAPFLLLRSPRRWPAQRRMSFASGGDDAFIPWPEVAASEAAPLPLRSRVIEARVTSLARGFFCVFAAFSTAQMLESSLHGPSGLACLFSIYGAFGVSAAAAPWLIGASAVTTTTAMAVSSVPYVALVASSLLPTRIEALSQIACVGVGLGAGTLWAAHGTYVGEAAVAFAAATDTSVSMAASRLNAIFYSTFFCSGIVANSAASVLMIAIPDATLAVRALFALLTFISGCGCAIIYFLVSPNDANDRIFAFSSCRTVVSGPRVVMSAAAPEEAKDGVSPPAVPSPLAVIRFLVVERPVRFLAPTAFATGAGAGFIIGSWMARAVAASVGAGYVGLAGTAYGIAAVLGMRVWGALAARQSWGRRWVFVVGFAIAALWYAATAAVWVGADPPSAVPDGSAMRVATALAAISAFAFTDSIFNALLNATVQTLYPARPALTCGIACMKISYCAGFSLQQIFALAMSARGDARLDYNAGACLLLLVVAALSLAYGHARVAHIDGVLRAESLA